MIEDYLQNAKSAAYKSDAERRIGGLLDQYGLPFIYEKPTAVMDAGQLRIWYPDFTLAYGPVLEYFGVNGDMAYAQRTQHKLRVYHQNQIPVLPLYPRDLLGQWQGRLLSRIDHGLQSRLKEYRFCVGKDCVAEAFYQPTRRQVR